MRKPTRQQLEDMVCFVKSLSCKNYMNNQWACSLCNQGAYTSFIETARTIPGFNDVAEDLFSPMYSSDKEPEGAKKRRQ